MNYSIKASSSLSRRVLIGALAPLVLLGAACGSDDDAGSDPEVIVADPWVRQPATGQPNGAAYGVITNTTDEEIVLIGAVTDLTDDVEVHETIAGAGGAMAMQEKEGGFPIAAGGSLVLEPGGPHIMLFGVDDVTFPDIVEMTWLFDDGSDDGLEVPVSAALRTLDPDQMMGSESTEMGGEDEMESDTTEMGG